ncbi:unnamed protein product [Rotaria sordida]|uniref:Uncharacterized protein n=1 Tax=Rotaria sordida TaxID=392033 RepID=A0A813Y6Z1_9BILA|nr:unnamed protein product [Rotaria sordida]CAF0877839.1 unnamed protein product [Rotaria sordida]CAF0937113.1 unnamed protein product [Rotaria sordida]CAF0969440.1 unnamed protein product [Rotaria sordida]CAF0980502.1 unnamed protein product [Rotaria sordida]
MSNDIIISSPTTITAVNENSTKAGLAIKNRLDQGKVILHDAFANMDRGTLLRAVIVLAGITCLILMYIGIKTFFLRKKRQPKRYTLITDPGTMAEPLFGAHDDEDEIEDDTLFVRK